MTPHASPYDGMLTFVFGFIVTRIKILKILPRTMRKGIGNYVEHPDISEFNAEWIKIKTTTETPMHTDGEIQAESIRNIDYRVIPKILPVLLLE